MGGDERHGLRAGVVQRAHGLADGAGGVDHVVDDHAVASLHVTDDAVCLGMVRARGVTGLVDEGALQSAAELSPRYIQDRYKSNGFVM